MQTSSIGQAVGISIQQILDVKLYYCKASYNGLD